MVRKTSSACLRKQISLVSLRLTSVLFVRISNKMYAIVVSIQIRKLEAVQNIETTKSSYNV